MKWVITKSENYYHKSAERESNGRRHAVCLICEIFQLSIYKKNNIYFHLVGYLNINIFNRVINIKRRTGL